MKALIFGVTGQDGSYLSEILLRNDIKVYGVRRRASTCNLSNLTNIKNSKFVLVEGDISDSNSVSNIISEICPDYIFNLAAQSHVHTSFEQPTNTFNVNTLGVLNILEAIRKFSPQSRLVQASTSEMFGNNYSIVEGKKIQNEDTAFDPISPYAVSKLAAHNLVRIYRDAYDIYACCAIMFNHESPRRGENFVTRKITKYVGELVKGRAKEKLQLGNLKACRDWSHAEDFMEAFRLMVLPEYPDNYVLCSNTTYSIEDFLVAAFGRVNLDWTEYVEVNPKFYRPIDVEFLQGCSNKAREKLNWEPKYDFNQLVCNMIDGDTK